MNNQKEHKQNIDDITACSRQIFIKENNKQKCLVVCFFVDFFCPFKMGFHGSIIF